MPLLFFCFRVENATTYDNKRGVITKKEQFFCENRRICPFAIVEKTVILYYIIEKFQTKTL